MNVQGKKTLLEIKTLLADMQISKEGLEAITEDIFQKIEQKERDGEIAVERTLEDLS